MPGTRRVRFVLTTVTALALAAPPAGAAEISTATAVVPMVFPVIGRVSYSDTFLACRSGCSRQHLGQDLMGAKMLPLVATFDGYVSSLKRETRAGEGNYVTLRGDNGWSANYVHVNNDRPGTDDGRGTPAYAFAPGLSAGDRVFAGQLLGWLGDSGNAEGTAPHLHFELRKGEAWSGVVYNAKPSLDRAVRLSSPRVSGPHPPGTFVRTPYSTAPTWRIEPDGKRKVSPAVLAALGFAPSHVVVVSAAEERWYRTLAPLPLPDGLVYRAPDGTWWVVAGGHRYPVADAAALAALRVAADRVRPADAAALAATPIGTGTPPALVRPGALLRETGTAQVWLVGSGGKRLAPDWYTLARHGRTSADVAMVPPGTTAALPVTGTLTLPDGWQLMDSIGRRYVVSGGARHHVGSAAAKLFGWTKVSYVRPPGAVAARLPLGTPLP